MERLLARLDALHARALEDRNRHALKVALARHEARKRREERTLPLRAMLDRSAQAQGYASHEEKKAVLRAKKAGLRWCVECARNVRPRARWGPARVLTLGLLTSGGRRCPRCEGDRFLAPAVSP